MKIYDGKLIFQRSNCFLLAKGLGALALGALFFYIGYKNYLNYNYDGSSAQIIFPVIFAIACLFVVIYNFSAVITGKHRITIGLDGVSIITLSETKFFSWTELNEKAYTETDNVTINLPFDDFGAWSNTAASFSGMSFYVFLEFLGAVCVQVRAKKITDIQQIFDIFQQVLAKNEQELESLSNQWSTIRVLKIKELDESPEQQAIAQDVWFKLKFVRPMLRILCAAVGFPLLAIGFSSYQDPILYHEHGLIILSFFLLVCLVINLLAFTAARFIIVRKEPQAFFSGYSLFGKLCGLTKIFDRVSHCEVRKERPTLKGVTKYYVDLYGANHNKILCQMFWWPKAAQKLKDALDKLFDTTEKSAAVAEEKKARIAALFNKSK